MASPECWHTSCCWEGARENSGGVTREAQPKAAPREAQPKAAPCSPTAPTAFAIRSRLLASLEVLHGQGPAYASSSSLLPSSGQNEPCSVSQSSSATGCRLSAPGSTPAPVPSSSDIKACWVSAYLTEAGEAGGSVGAGTMPALLTSVCLGPVLEPRTQQACHGGTVNSCQLDWATGFSHIWLTLF